ncbi:NADH-ubiquinone oxidoreductase chain 3 [Capsicum annuum]|nr:NADH-ubiquinone oxidoreductase chain 3 [Capsicum annuum]
MVFIVARIFFFPYAATPARSKRTKFSVVMSEFAPICIYLVISPLVSLIPLGLPFLFSSNSSTYPEKLSAYECGFDPFGDARSHFDIRFYLVSILFIIPDPKVTFSFPTIEEVLHCVLYMSQETAGPIPYPNEAAEKRECREEYPYNKAFPTGQRSFLCADRG